MFYCVSYKSLAEGAINQVNDSNPFPYPLCEEIAKLWDADTQSPAMILFKDGKPVTRLYGESFYLDVVSKIGKFCRAPGEEHQEIKK